jgi:hypothetical protein
LTVKGNRYQTICLIFIVFLSASLIPCSSAQEENCCQTSDPGPLEIEDEIQELCISGTKFNALDISQPNAPPKATLISPSGAITERMPNYLWNGVPESTWYYLQVSDTSRNVLDQWYRAENICSGGTCSATPSVALDDDEYSWRIRTYNEDGCGSWSEPMDFEVNGTGFDEHFDGSEIPPDWTVLHGDWSVGNGWLYSLNYGDNYSSDENWRSVYYDANFSDFYYEAKTWRSELRDGWSCSNALVVRGNPYPLCDGDKGWDSAYYFQYVEHGNYGIWKSTENCDWEWIQPWTYTDAINQGAAWNTLKVSFSKNQMDFFINDVLVWSGTDESFDAGCVGLSFYPSCGGGFWIDYATLKPVYFLSQSEISDLQKMLNEEAIVKNTGLSKEKWPVREGNERR